MRQEGPFTEDAIFHGALRLRQHRNGYRFTEDAVLVASFAARGGRARQAADLGAGCGVVGLMLLHAGAADRVLALELQPGLARLAAHNAEVNGLGARFVAATADLRRAPVSDSSLDLVVCNPPYTPLGRGRPPAGGERALARHELACTVSDLAHAAARCLAPGGRLVVVYPADRLDEVRARTAAAGLVASRTRLVRPRPDRPPALALVEVRAGGGHGQPVEEPPLLARLQDGRRTAEMEGLMAGRFLEAAE